MAYWRHRGAISVKGAMDGGGGPAFYLRGAAAPDEEVGESGDEASRRLHLVELLDPLPALDVSDGPNLDCDVGPALSGVGGVEAGGVLLQ